MKIRYLVLVFLLIISAKAHAQVAVTVTNPGNTSPALAASYTSLALAITALNGITAISGPVTLTCAAGTETAPAGGYSISFTAATTLANNIVITGTATTTITASAALTAGSLTDAIFKIIGCDYITIKNFTMLENGNSTTASATNNMTEWGVALLHSSITNGAQYNTIQNNSISLNRSYPNSFGIYSNVRHSATLVTTLQDITNSTTAPNNGNTVASNTISNVNMGIAFIGSGVAANQDHSNYVGYSATTGNTISNWGGAAATGGFISNTGTSYCIYYNHQVDEKISYNIITSAVVSGTAVAFRGIYKDFATTAPTSNFVSSITSNTITMSSAFTSGTFEAIRSQGATAGIGNIFISANTILNCAISGVSSSSTLVGIVNSSAAAVLTISNNIFRGNTSTATTGGFTGISNTGPVVATVTTININNNQLGNASGGLITFAAVTTGAINGILNSAGDVLATLNINNNSFDGISVVTSLTIRAINNTASIGVAININNNLLGSTTGTWLTTNGAQSNSIVGIFNTAAVNSSTAVSIQYNDITGIFHPAGATCTHQYLTSNAAAATNIVSNNTFTNISANTTGTVTFIIKSGVMLSGTSFTMSNNSIVGFFNKAGSLSGDVFVYACSSASVTGSTSTISSNSFSNITVSGTSSFYGIYDSEGIVTDAPVKTISGNTLNNVSLGSGTGFGIYVSAGLGVSITSNTISNISGGDIVAISALTNIGASTCSISSNTITGLSTTGNVVTGVNAGSANSTNFNINNNTISGLSSSGASTQMTGISIGGNQTNNIYDNIINSFSATGTISLSITGISASTGVNLNIYRNKIYTFTVSGAISTSSPAVIGMWISSISGTATIYNNFVSDLKATNANLTDAIRGIWINGFTASTTYNLYYNSIYLNAVSSGTNFGTCGILHTTSATATTARLNMIDNIIVNTSTPNGTGKTVAYRRSDAILTNYASTSNYNDFYAGTPGVNNLIYYDGTNSEQTLAAYQTRVGSPRDVNSISILPVFTSTTDLHLTTANCNLDNKGTPIPGYTNDIDLATRNSSLPDIGADEFSTSPGVLAGIIGGHVTQVCVSKTVGSGSIYTTGACEPVAMIIPSGALPVTGTINACVTIQPLSPFPDFNLEPYVQRYFDIEAVTLPTISTATITLYFKDQEFIDFNANNGLWPNLPTVAGGGNGDLNITNLRVTQYHGTAVIPWGPGNYTVNGGKGTLITPTTVNWNATDSRWEVSFPITGFSGFYVHTNLFEPLPVSVNYLRGLRQGSDHLLNWKVTCNSTPGVTMTLERSSSSSGGFAGINTISATAADCAQPFNYTDAQPLKGMNYYRLKIIDINGKVTFSNTIALLNATKGFDIMNIAPNPVTGSTFKLNIASAQTTKMDVVIADMQGRVLSRQTISLISGYNSIDMNVTNLAKGTYNIYGTTADERSKLIRFVKQ